MHELHLPSIIASSTLFSFLARTHARTHAVYQRGAVDSEKDSSSKIITTPPPPPPPPPHQLIVQLSTARPPPAIICIQQIQAPDPSLHNPIPPRQSDRSTREVVHWLRRPQRAFAQQHRPCWLDLPVLLSYHHPDCAPLPTTPPVSCLSVQRQLHPSTPPSPACSAGVCIACCHESVAHSHPGAERPFHSLNPTFPRSRHAFTTSTTTHLSLSAETHTGHPPPLL